MNGEVVLDNSSDLKSHTAGGWGQLGSSCEGPPGPGKV